MIDMGTNTLDVEVRPQRDGSRVMTLEDNAQASCPLVDVILPMGMNEQVSDTSFFLFYTKSSLVSQVLLCDQFTNLKS